MVSRRITVIALVVVAVALLTTGALVALHILAAPARTAPPAPRDYRHEHLVWSFQTKPGGMAAGVGFGADDTLVVAGPTDGSGGQGVTGWNIGTHQRIAAIACSTVSAIATSPDGRQLAIVGACGQDSGVQLWDLPGQRLISALPVGDMQVICVRFSPSGRLLAGCGTAFSASGINGVAGVWDIATHQRTGDLAAGDQLPNVSAVAVSPDDRTVVAAANSGMPGTENNAVQLWDVATGKLTGVLSHQPANAAVFSPDGRVVAVATQQDKVELWDVAGQRLTGTMISDPKYGTASFWDEAYSPDGSVLAAADFNGDLTLWDVGTGQVITTLTCHCATQQVGLTHLAFSPDGTYLAAGGEGDTVDVWSSP